jgi:lipid II:glycine glycyltransferase (peptidoglycan interpeptide bridge formation enzyme)
VPGLRFGCILDGPVTPGGWPMEAAVVRELVKWAHRNRYVALRVTHSSETFLDSLADTGNTDRIDAVPFYPHPTSELYVELSSDDSSMLSRFQAVARRNIRQARDAGYVISVDHDPRAMEKAWPAFESRSAQKGIRYRDRETYARMMHEAEPHRAAHLYTAWRKERPIAAILVLRDCTTAHYFLGTIDIDALGDDPSPACLLHWHAMRHAAEMGNTFYNLGTRSGPVYTFKSKFRPVEHERPAPLTFAINPRLYRLWRRLLPSVARVVS